MIPCFFEQFSLSTDFRRFKFVYQTYIQPPHTRMDEPDGNSTDMPPAGGRNSFCRITAGPNSSFKIAITPTPGKWISFDELHANLVRLPSIPPLVRVFRSADSQIRSFPSGSSQMILFSCTHFASSGESGPLLRILEPFDGFDW